MRHYVAATCYLGRCVRDYELVARRTAKKRAGLGENCLRIFCVVKSNKCPPLTKMTLFYQLWPMLAVKLIQYDVIGYLLDYYLLFVDLHCNNVCTSK